mmetsp:Transcript_48191/g.111681  ORF Transcript_48191/g.111681 Transcript_48191/m.111681 type:complete len:200 (-) Transcript_48191:144-743(-)
MLREEFLLEAGCEPIEGHESDQEKESVEASATALVFRLERPCTEELHHTTSDQDSGGPIQADVVLTYERLPPHHHRQHLAALAKDLHREGNVLQGLVLADTGSNCCDGDQRVLPDRGSARGVLASARCHDPSKQHTDDPVAEDKECGASEVLTVVRIHHDPLLPETVQQQRSDYAYTIEGATEQPSELLPVGNVWHHME